MKRIKLVLNSEEIEMIKRYTTLSAYSTMAIVNLSIRGGVDSVTYNEYVLMRLNTEETGSPVIGVSSEVVDSMPRLINIYNSAINYSSRVSLGIAQKVNLAVYDALKNGMTIDINKLEEIKSRSEVLKK